MDWIIQHLMANDTIVAAGLTFILSVLGARKSVAQKLNSVFTITKESLDVVQSLSKALKPDDDGRIRIDKNELGEIQKEVSELKKAIGQIVALR